jgi:hypothetical protein
VFDAQSQDKLYQDLHALAAPKVADAHQQAAAAVPAAAPEIMDSTVIDIAAAERVEPDMAP